MLIRPLRLALVLAALAMAGPAAFSQDRRTPAVPVQTFEPDPLTCKSDNLLAAYRRQLSQFASQPPKVLARLREVQLEMGEATLKRCAALGHLSRPEAEQIWREFQLMPLPTATVPSPAPAPVQRP